MKQILLPVAADPTISLSFSFRVGSQDDPPGREGLAALTAALLTAGSSQRNSYDSILEQLYPLATTYYATVDKEQSTISGRVHRDKLADFLPLIQDAVLRPAFRRADFERLKNDAINFVGSTLRYDSDEELGKAALTSAVFAGTPYAHPVRGSLSGLAAITLDDVIDCYRRHYTRAKLVTGLAGGYEPDLLTTLETDLAALPAGDSDMPPAIEPRPGTGRRVVLIDKPGADASISFGFPLKLSRGERDFYALWLANSWLGEHRHSVSHLFQVIRGDRGLNYGDYSYIEAFPDGGRLEVPPVNIARRRQLFEVWLRTLPNDQAIFALRAALRELDRLIEKGLTYEQFERTRKFLSKYSAQYAPTSAARLGYAIDDAFYGIGSEGHLERFGEMMALLTRDEVNAAVREHWQTGDMTIAIVTGRAEALAQALANGEPTPLEYPGSMPARILEEDREIAAYPLGVKREAIERWPVASLFN